MKTSTTHFIMASIAIATLTVFVQACTESRGNDNKIPRRSEPVPVRVMQLSKSASTNAIIASGKLTTNDETILGFKIGGVVNAVLVNEGDQVKKGQLLATLDLTEINAQVAQARYAYEKAQRDFQRAENLYKDSVATLEQLQNAETGLSVVKKQLEAASFNQNFAAIHAPASGYVLRKFVNPGQVVGIGDPILQTNGAMQGYWILETGVSDKQWAEIKVKDEAVVHLDAIPDHPFKAFVSRKSGASDPMTGAFTVELQLTSEDVKLAAGMFGSAEIRSGESMLSWKVPYESVLDANDESGFVFVTRDQTTASKVPVTIESFDGENIYISRGLEDAKALIISGSAYLTDNSPITIIP